MMINFVEKKMKFSEYQELFTQIISNPSNEAPYNDHSYLEYTKLNNSRLNRWLKKGELLEEIKKIISEIKAPQKWILISEPWCGDAAHSVPFIFMMSELSKNISLEIQLRDSDSEIDSYLTNGGKSIPILIIRNEKNEDLAVWGPRPEKCKILFEELKEKQLTFEEQKIILQNWYNEDKGIMIQEEIGELLKSI